MRRSAPPSRRWVAKEWRRVCGLTRSGSPAAAAARFTAPQACCLAHRPPRSPTNRGAPRSGATWPSASSGTRGPWIQSESTPSAMSPTGTSRSLSPFPMTRTKPPSIERSSRSRPRASEIRRPEAYSSSRSARSRRGRHGCPSVEFEAGAGPPAASMSRSTSSMVRVSGRSLDIRGRSRWAATSIPMTPSPNANR